MEDLSKSGGLVSTHEFPQLADLSHMQLTEFVQHLIDHDFDKLLQLLYRMDIDETLLREALHPGSPSLPCDVITKMIIDRIAAREKSRRETKLSNPNDIPEGERW